MRRTARRTGSRYGLSSTVAWSAAEGQRFYAAALAIEEEARVAVAHETHRGRALFTAPLAAAFLAGALDNTLVIAPRMASNDGAGCKDALGPNEISWNCNSWRSGGPALSNPGVTSFDFLDEVLLDRQIEAIRRRRHEKLVATMLDGEAEARRERPRERALAERSRCPLGQRQERRALYD